MTPHEELLRRAVLKDQAALLLRQDADRHEAEAKRLRKMAALLERKKRIHDLWVTVQRIPQRFRLWWLERKIGRGWDRYLSLQIDQIITRLEEGSRP